MLYCMLSHFHQIIPFAPFLGVPPDDSKSYQLRRFARTLVVGGWGGRRLWRRSPTLFCLRPVRQSRVRDKAKKKRLWFTHLPPPPSCPTPSYTPSPDTPGMGALSITMVFVGLRSPQLCIYSPPVPNLHPCGGPQFCCHLDVCWTRRRGGTMELRS